MRRLPEKILDVIWPWGRIRRLKNALAQALADNAVLHDRLDKMTDRDAKGRFKK